MRDPSSRSNAEGLSVLELREFRMRLLAWFKLNQRDLPWRRTSDPYAIWISEIMLQQTRVAAVLPFYEKFMARFPNCKSLAEAREEDVLAQWAGLGYYYRARHLQKAAQTVTQSDCFPASCDKLRELPGIGNYTSAAIASIAFNLPHAAVDGNVLRVLSRVYADGTNIASLAGKKHFSYLADELLDKQHPGDFNQAMMELGATVCLPKAPQCLVCPVQEVCRARRTGVQADLPVKPSKTKTIREHRFLLWICRQGELLVWRRPADSSLMAGFFELPEMHQLPGAAIERKLGSFRHGITFHDYRFDVFEAEATDTNGFEWISIIRLAACPVSTILRKAKRVAEGNTRANAATAR